jgi:hypothetical protein
LLERGYLSGNEAEQIVLGNLDDVTLGRLRHFAASLESF